MHFNKTSKEKLRGQFFKFLLPSIGSMWFFALYTTLDGIFVGKGVGPEALAAVNLANPFVSLIFTIALLFSVGSSNIVTGYLGQGKKDKANEIFTLNFLLILVISVLLSISTLVFKDQVISFLGASGQLAVYLENYLVIVAIGAPFIALSYCFEILIKADGNPSKSFKVLLVTCLLNIFGNYLLIYVFDMGLRGAAISTIIAQFISFVIFLNHFLYKSKNLKFVKPEINKEIVFDIVRRGFPDALTELSAGFVTFLYNYSIIRVLGTRYLPAFSVILYVSNLIIVTIQAVTQGMQPLVSFYDGKKDRKSVMYLLKVSVKSAIVLSLIFFGIIEIFAPQIVSVFLAKTDMDLFNYSVYALRIYSVSFLALSLNIVNSGYLNAVKQSTEAIVISALRGYISIAVCLLILPNIFGGFGIWSAVIFSEIFTFFISFAYLKGKGVLKLSSAN